MKSKTDRLLEKLINLHPKYIDLSLNRLEKLLKKLGDPHLGLPKTIHIAGTNGKGSTQSFIRNILVSNGYSCDAYISPHLSKFNERIILNNKNVSTKKLYSTLEFVRKKNNDDPITFFEITTAAAFILFQQSKSDFLILETGLGGRLDATNIIPKKLFSIITPISFDHQEFLGNTILKITKEKLGIIKKSEYVLISKQKKEVKKFILEKLTKKKNFYYYSKDFKIININKKTFQFQFKKNKRIIKRPKLNGLHQIENAAVALAFSEIMLQNKLDLNYKKINKAIRDTAWPGRLEIINFNNKKIILDGSHNVDGAKRLSEFLKSNNLNPCVVFGMLNNKEIKIFLNTIKNHIKNILAVEIPDEKHSFKNNEILDVCNSLAIQCLRIQSLNKVIKHINKSNQRIFLITGSLYLVGKIRDKLL